MPITNSTNVCRGIVGDMNDLLGLSPNINLQLHRNFGDTRTRVVFKNLRKNGKDGSASHVPRSFSPGNIATAAKAQEKLTRIISCDTSGVLNHQNEDLDIQYNAEVSTYPSLNVK